MATMGHTVTVSAARWLHILLTLRAYRILFKRLRLDGGVGNMAQCPEIEACLSVIRGLEGQSWS